MTDTSPDRTLRSNLRSMTTDITLSPFFRDIARKALAQIEAHDAEIASWQEHAAGNGKEADEIYAELVEARRQRDEALARVKQTEVALKALDYWFDTDPEILEAMSADERADHDRQRGIIRAALAKQENLA